MALNESQSNVDDIMLVGSTPVGAEEPNAAVIGPGEGPDTEFYQSLEPIGDCSNHQAVLQWISQYYSGCTGRIPKTLDGVLDAGGVKTINFDVGSVIAVIAGFFCGLLVAKLFKKVGQKALDVGGEAAAAYLTGGVSAIGGMM